MPSTPEVLVLAILMTVAFSLLTGIAVGLAWGFSVKANSDETEDHLAQIKKLKSEVRRLRPEYTQRWDAVLDGTPPSKRTTKSMKAVRT